MCFFWLCVVLRIPIPLHSFASICLHRWQPGVRNTKVSPSLVIRDLNWWRILFFSSSHLARCPCGKRAASLSWTACPWTKRRPIAWHLTIQRRRIWRSLQPPFCSWARSTGSRWLPLRPRFQIPDSGRTGRTSTSRQRSWCCCCHTGRTSTSRLQSWCCTLSR